MIGVVALRWAPQDQAARLQVTRLGDQLRTDGWVREIERPAWEVWREDRPGRWMTHSLNEGETVVIGRLFDRAATEAGTVVGAAFPASCDRFEDLCERLIAESWGAYVAVCCDSRRSERIEMFRDPIGMIECATWTSGGVRVVASRPESILSLLPPTGFGIDWSRLADIMLRPVIVSDQIALRAIDVVEPGTLVRYDGPRREARCLWSPISFAQPDHISLASPHIRDELIDTCVAAWASCSDCAVAELSGGLDSAIVAAGAVRVAATPIRSWFNYYVSDRGGDERRFASAVAERLKLPLTTIFCPDDPIGEQDLDGIPVAIRPGFGSTSFVHDADLARRSKALGADMLFTGNGGDSVFFQDPSPMIAADLQGDQRSLTEKAVVLSTLSAWTGANIWSMAIIATGLHRPSFTLPESGCDFLHNGLVRQPDPIGWLVGSDALAPAKQLQILHLAIARSSFGSSRCAQAMSVVHPLMAQPVLEHVLPIRAIALTEGQRDRALARRAYLNRLPAMLIARRGKGCVTAYFGRRLAASTDFLKDYLLGGTLAAQRVIDPHRLEPILDPNFLMHSDRYSGLLLALLAERWARVWSDRCQTCTSAMPSALPI